jgi:hypothetical protein
MDLVRAGQIVLIMLTPTLAVGAAIYLPRVAKALWLRIRPEDSLGVTGQPIEQIAADLQRLLLQHHELRHTPQAAMRGRRLRALEAAITDCAVEAAQALGVPAPAVPPHAGMRPAALSRLLHDLAAAGLVLPSGVDLVEGNRRS